MKNQLKETFDQVKMPAECAQRIQNQIQLRSSHKELEAITMKPKKKPLIVLVAVFVLMFALSATAYAANEATGGELLNRILVIVNGKEYYATCDDGSFTYHVGDSKITGQISEDRSSAQFNIYEDSSAAADADNTIEVIVPLDDEAESDSSAPKSGDSSDVTPENENAPDTYTFEFGYRDNPDSSAESSCPATP